MWICERRPLGHVKLSLSHATAVFELLESAHRTVKILDSFVNVHVIFVVTSQDRVDAPLAALGSSPGAEFLHASTTRIGGASLFGCSRCRHPGALLLNLRLILRAIEVIYFVVVLVI